MVVDVMSQQSSVVLSDGTRLEELYDLERRRISARLFSDPEIFRLEMNRLFSHSWLFVGLESEIPEPGDYVTRPMGGDSVIVNRGQEGEVNILLNRCTHRGTQLCVTDCGHTQQFRCPYHGWLFGTDGRLRALPNAQDWLGENGNKAEYAMRKARVAVHGGLIFGTFDEELIDFEEYLGEFGFYYDMLFRAVDKDLVAVGAPQRWRVPFNWKLGAENFAGDTYHLQTAHASLSEIGMVPPLDDMQVAFVTEPRFGHGFQAVRTPPPADPPPVAMTMSWLPGHILPELDKHMNAEQMALINEGAFPLVGTFFPNTSWLASPFFFFMRTWQPISPNEIEIWTWTIAHPDATPEERKGRTQGVNLTFGATGMFEQDDMTIFNRIQRMHDSVIGGREEISYAGRAGDPTDEWPGPGRAWYGVAADDHIWNFHLRYLHRMTGGEV
jgi:phenylpropionate dioxygenase-like ring-hydroxylating dioxygenase large terminal subunit